MFTMLGVHRRLSILENAQSFLQVHFHCMSDPGGTRLSVSTANCMLRAHSVDFKSKLLDEKFKSMSKAKVVPCDVTQGCGSIT